MIRAIVVPFRGENAKRRLRGLAEPVRAELALAMLGDVLAACVATAPTTVVTGDSPAASLAAELGARAHADPGGGQGAAVAAALALLSADEPALVVNADVPCAVPHDLRTLAAAVPPDGLALVAAADRTTNALALAEASLFTPDYGEGSAERFLGHLPAVEAVIPNLADDVDTLDDLRRVSLRAGPRTQAAIASLGIAA